MLSVTNAQIKRIHFTEFIDLLLRVNRPRSNEAHFALQDGEELRKFIAKLVHDAHTHMIGDSDAPVQITGEELVPIVRDEAAATIPTLTLPVPRIGALALMNHVLDWLLPIAAIATASLT